jgi:sec-independent protein translocase protein TatC
LVKEERKRAEARMTVVEHLTELRTRLVISVLAFLAGSIVAYFFYAPILDLLKSPLDEGGKIAGITVDEGLSVSGITTAFLLRIKVSLFAGFVLALPVILLQVWRFITPGLEKKEKRFAIPFVAGSVLLFAAGAVIAYLTLPSALGFLLRFTEGFNSIIFVNDYVGFVTFLVLAFGITFELPMVLIFLAMVGIVTSAWMRRHRRHAIVATFIIAAVATPSQDPYTLVLMAVPLYLLYETSLLIIRFGMRK